MKTPNITIESLKKAYNNGCDDVKEVLKNLYGTEVFENGEIKTFEDACKVLDIDDYEKLPNKDEKSIDAHRKLIVIARALNGGWTPDWNDSSQKKWYPWFKMSSGFGFYYSNWTYTAAYFTGSRLCFKSEKLADYAGKKFTKLYEEFLT